MTDKTVNEPLEELREELRRATGESHELSFQICAALGAVEVREDDSKAFSHVTSSIDAALALVERVLPEANSYGAEKAPKGWDAHVSRNFVSSGHWLFEAHERPTGALAILDALLSALISQSTRKGVGK